MSLIFLLIEFFDELHYGIQSAVLPSLRADLGLTYTQVGLLLGLPAIINTLVEPALMLLGDTRLRRPLVIGGGAAIALSLLLIAEAQSFPLILLAFIVVFPASGAFVSLSQAALVDLKPGREPHSMARWTVFGSLGNLAGPAVLAGVFALGLSWRWAYLGLAVIAAGLVASLLRKRFMLRPAPAPTGETTPTEPGWKGARHALAGIFDNLLHAVRNRLLLRWIGLLVIADLLLDVFISYSALYFSDVVGLTAAQTSLVLSGLMLSHLISDLVLIPLLERIPGRKVVRASAWLALVVYPAFLLAPWPWAKIVLGAAACFCTLGWYPVLQGEAYAAAPGRSGAMLALNSLSGLVGGGLVWLIGLVANQAGLQAAMWLLLFGPLGLILFTPPPLAKSPVLSYD